MKMNAQQQHHEYSSTLLSIIMRPKIPEYLLMLLVAKEFVYIIFAGSEMYNFEVSS